MKRPFRSLLMFLTILFISSLFLFLPVLTAIAAPTFKLAAESKMFTDVPTGSANERFIHFLKNKGLINGFQNGKFYPTKGITRAEAAIVLAKIKKSESASSQTDFVDVPQTHWAASSIAALKDTGLIKGYCDKSFRPDLLLTRAECAELMIRLANEINSVDISPPVDDVPNDNWAANSVGQGIASGMVSSTEDNKLFLPNKMMTRGDFARVLSIVLTNEPTLAETDLIGQLKVIKGTAVLTHLSRKMDLGFGEQRPVTVGDTIKNGIDGEAQIIYPDGSGILLKGTNAELIIKESTGRTYIKGDATVGTSVEQLHAELKRGTMIGVLSTVYQYDQSGESTTYQYGQSGAGTAAAADEKDFIIAGKTTKETAAIKKNCWRLGRWWKRWWKAYRTKRVRVKVDMPWGVAGVRGTAWAITTGDEGPQRISALTGEVEFTLNNIVTEVSAGQALQNDSAGQETFNVETFSDKDDILWNSASSWLTDRVQDIEANRGLASVLTQTADGKNFTLVLIDNAEDDTANAILNALDNLSGVLDVLDIEISPPETTLTVGTTGQFSATVTKNGELIDNPDIAWTTEGDIGTIDGNGLLTAANEVASGKVTATYQGETAEASVVIIKPVLTSIAVTPNPATVVVGNTQIFTARGYDQYGSEMNIAPTWSIEGSTMGVIDKNGLFTAMSGGKGKITATVGNIAGKADIFVTYR